MQPAETIRKEIFSIRNRKDFDRICLAMFRFQAVNNPVYREYIRNIGVGPDRVSDPLEIPFLPIQFFKTHRVVTGTGETEKVFLSSGTTGTVQSRHYVRDIRLYETSFTRGFEYFYGPVTGYCILALLPGYLEREGSSLVYMMDSLIRQSGHPGSGFYLRNFTELEQKIGLLSKNNDIPLLFGVSHALLELGETLKELPAGTIVMETGGMKGEKKEITREELHTRLSGTFGIPEIHSEYGMTELLSQAYSKGKGIFFTPAWMKVIIRDPYDPFYPLEEGRTGGINIIDLANIHSCSFIETQDLGRRCPGGGFEVLGRFDGSDIRGCNLLSED